MAVQTENQSRECDHEFLFLTRDCKKNIVSSDADKVLALLLTQSFVILCFAGFTFLCHIKFG